MTVLPEQRWRITRNWFAAPPPLLVPDHISEIWGGGHVKKNGLRDPYPVHRVRDAPWNRNEIPRCHDLGLIANSELDLPRDEVQEMMACWVCVPFDLVFQAIDPDVHVGRLSERGELKPFVLLKRLVVFDSDGSKILVNS